MKKWVYASWPDGRPPCRECRHATRFAPTARQCYCAKAKAMTNAKIASMGAISLAMEGCKHWEGEENDER